MCGTKMLTAFGSISKTAGVIPAGSPSAAM